MEYLRKHDKTHLIKVLSIRSIAFKLQWISLENVLS